ncbi:Uu.00g042720.m01.CDS01 [Anthostomella pinea]|uniref:Uu.00g042720.m01.CDS01 n=1 Tax=Anthostomella pinea TaxID=933095 RepID=A0AAI8YBR5_9PEZI|nr:Uu.00g042720.m01.CDS01 [Anthostomella pinea]
MRQNLIYVLLSVSAALSAAVSNRGAMELSAREAYPFTVQDLHIADWEVKSDAKVEDLGINLDTYTTTRLDDLKGKLKGKKEASLVLLPTENKRKMKVMEQGHPDADHPNVFFQVSAAKSDVGEQPYNEAGAEGAANRIRNSVTAFLDGSFLPANENGFGNQTTLEWCLENEIGKIYFFSIENYIQGTRKQKDKDYGSDHKKNEQIEANVNDVMEAENHDGWTLEDAVDYGCAAAFDVFKNKAFRIKGDGVRVPSPEGYDLVKVAMARGHDDRDWRHGRLTVGSVIAAVVDPKSKGADPEHTLDADWHYYVSGGKASRYDILEKAVAQLREALFGLNRDGDVS